MGVKKRYHIDLFAIGSGIGSSKGSKAMKGGRKDIAGKANPGKGSGKGGKGGGGAAPIGGLPGLPGPRRP